MREIKFKAWDRKTGEWFDPILVARTIDTGYKSHIVYESQWHYDNDMPSHKIDLVQYTGLKDNHGVEIYEGDIVEGWLPDPMYDEYDFVGQVMWVEDGFAVCRVDGEYASGLINCALNSTIRVIGNIYETPELLN